MPFISAVVIRDIMDMAAVCLIAPPNAIIMAYVSTKKSATVTEATKVYYARPIAIAMAAAIALLPQICASVTPAILW